MNLATFDLNLLRVLDALLAEPSTVRAGARIGLSQPAVSAALGRLRAAFDDELFFRRGQGLAPTDFALALRDPVREVLERVERMLTAPAAFDARAAETRFVISGSDFFAEMLMPELARRLARRAPGVRVHLVDRVPDGQFGALESREVDLALTRLAGLPGWVGSEPAFTSTFVAIARRGHPRLERAGVAPGAVLPLDLFCDIGQVMFSPEGRTAALADAALARIGRRRRVVMTLPVFSGVYRAVATSDLVAMLPAALARSVAGSAGLDIYKLPMPVPPARLGMVWHRGATADPGLAWLRAQVRAILEPLDEGGAADQ